MKIEWSRLKNYRLYLALPWILLVLLFIAIPVFLTLLISELLIFTGQSLKRIDRLPHFGAFGLASINKWIRDNGK